MVGGKILIVLFATIYSQTTGENKCTSNPVAKNWKTDTMGDSPYLSAPEPITDNNGLGYCKKVLTGTETCCSSGIVG